MPQGKKMAQVGAMIAPEQQACRIPCLARSPRGQAGHEQMITHARWPDAQLGGRRGQAPNCAVVAIPAHSPRRGVGEATSHPAGDRRASPNPRAWAHEALLQAQPGCCMGRKPHCAGQPSSTPTWGCSPFTCCPTPWGSGVPHRSPTGDRRASLTPGRGQPPSMVGAITIHAPRAHCRVHCATTRLSN